MVLFIFYSLFSTLGLAICLFLWLIVLNLTKVSSSISLLARNEVCQPGRKGRHKDE
jgi:hypothetical protein